MRARTPAGAAVAAAWVLVLAGCAAGEATPPGFDATAAAQDPAPTVAAAEVDEPAAPTEEPAPVRTPAAQSPDPATAAGDDSESAPAAAGCELPGGCFGEPRVAGTFDEALVSGASGLAASRRNPGILWLLDDRPGTREVWALVETGGLAGSVAVEGLDALDTEALAVGPCAAPGGAAERSCVYVGDIGDNRRSRDHVTVHRFEEPDLAGGLPAAPVPAGRARLSYPDGAHDAEALLVDGDGGLLIVTKAAFDAERGVTGEARLYGAATFADGVLADLGPVPVPEPALPLHSLLVGNVVTGGDAHDGRVLLRTYDQVLLYMPPHAGAPLATLASWSVRALPSPVELQSEAIAWAADGCGYYTVGERAGDLWSVPCER